MRIEPQNMKIDRGSQTHRADGRPELQAARRSADRGPTDSIHTDRAVLSPLAQDILQARRALADVPEVRQDVVDEMRGMLADGTYEVDASLVADRMLAGAE